MPDAEPASSQPSADPSRDVDGILPEIAGYAVHKRLGRGGMATVYLATQLSLDRPVAIKVMDDAALANEMARQRFENEARTIAHLSHPHIVAIHEVGRCGDGRPFYVMPYLGSGDLSQRDLRNDEPRAVAVLRSLLSALGYAHARGIVHRDVKRENVLFDADDRPMLADFGIALSRKDDVRLTTAGLAVGSSGGMAPEQARGEVVDGRADLYSVGVLAWEMLTGTMPFQADDTLALAIMHAQDPIPRLPPGKRHWQAFIDRAMAKKPADRFANARDMEEALGRLTSRPGGGAGRVLQAGVRSGWKKPAAWAAGALALVAAAFIVRGRMHAAPPTPVQTASTTVAATQPAPIAASPATIASTSMTSAAIDSPPSPASAGSADADASVASDAADASSASAADASTASAASSQASSSIKKPARRARARRPERRPNFIKRWWHRL